MMPQEQFHETLGELCWALMGLLAEDDHLSTGKTKPHGRHS